MATYGGTMANDDGVEVVDDEGGFGLWLFVLGFRPRDTAVGHTLPNPI